MTIVGVGRLPHAGASHPSGSRRDDGQACGGSHPCVTVEALEAPYGERILRLFRDAMRIDDPIARVREIVTLAEELGLEPPPPPQPLPEITPDDVHLVCWIALVPAGGSRSHHAADPRGADLRVSPRREGVMPEQRTRRLDGPRDWRHLQ